MIKSSETSRSGQEQKVKHTDNQTPQIIVPEPRALLMLAVAPKHIHPRVWVLAVCIKKHRGMPASWWRGSRYRNTALPNWWILG